ncbi:serine/threonine-protein kinase [Nannocystis bainbridge]|uniref:Protein kinase n=1 Tax=Nannocystis bainbridge TaxID=2995303 RepID=A0ABT5EA25_9BACT|nr:serine/threonine-protein kinase [Nannocystis bainbridge]MDC0722697.1 protein kinase [Nannocystis bainbridge]
MATNEGSRDSGQAGEDRSGPRLTAVIVDPPDSLPSAPVVVPGGDDDFAEEYEAALENQISAAHFSIELGRVSQEVESDGAPTSVDGEPQGEDVETVERTAAQSLRGKAAAKRDGLFGQVLADRYRILDLIGKGGMGKVYLAEHVALGKRVAVKVLNPAYTNRPDQVKRFLREARAASTIGHENVIDITDFGAMPNGQVFFAMEHLQGDDLGKILKKGPMTWARARRVMLQICRALQAAHTHGIIHRDMKPENCFLIQRNGIRDFVKVLDFGIAKFLEENRDGGTNPLTQVGALIGTPEYMAPEQIHGDPADQRMDIYAVGCILYQLLTGNLPFTDKTMYGVLSQQVNAKPVPPRQLAPDADIPVEVEAVILKAMEKDKTQRYQTMGELIEAIVATPRGTAVDAGRTTTNLEAAAQAARLAVGMGMGGSLSAGPNPVTPDDSLLTQGLSSASGLRPTSLSLPWRGGTMDAQMLTRLVFGLGAVVLALVVGLVCALNRGDDPKPPVDKPSELAAASAGAPEAVKPVETAPETQIEAKPDTKVEPTAEPKKPDDEPPIVVDDEAKKDPASKKPVEAKKPPPVKKSEPATPKNEEASANWPELLGPMERSQALKSYRAEFETCRTISTPKGKTYKLRLKVDGPKGRVTDATSDDTSAEAKCLARAFKTKVRFVNSRKTPQEFTIVVPL